MANGITRHIPNTITLLNLISGAVACTFAFEGNYMYAMLFIIAGAVFDFFDGMTARLLHAPSPIGKELDSLADDITFGLAPATMVFSLLREMTAAETASAAYTLLPYTAFILAAFSALRLAKFNIDERQTTSFIGLPTPANALFWSSLITSAHDFLLTSIPPLAVIAGVIVFSWLLVAEIPMFSLKFKSLAWQKNRIQYVFLLVSAALIAVFHTGGIAAVIVWYILLSLLTQKK